MTVGRGSSSKMNFLHSSMEMLAICNVDVVKRTGGVLSNVNLYLLEVHEVVRGS